MVLWTWFFIVYKTNESICFLEWDIIWFENFKWCPKLWYSSSISIIYRSPRDLNHHRKERKKWEHIDTNKSIITFKESIVRLGDNSVSRTWLRNTQKLLSSVQCVCSRFCNEMSPKYAELISINTSSINFVLKKI